MKHQKIIRLFFVLFINVINCPLLVAMNLLQPYDTLIRPPLINKWPFQFIWYAETGFNDVGFDGDGNKVDVLQIWQPDQSSLKMLDGFDPNSIIGQLRTRLDANDDGIRGHFNVTSKLKLNYALAFAARYYFLNDWSIGAYLPFYSLQLHDVRFQDLTQMRTQADVRVKELLTNNFFANVKALGDNLELQGWKRSGFGDLTLLLEWFHDFKQQKPFLKNVRVNWRGGLIIPTGKPRNEDEIFSIPLGSDRAFGIPFGLGLDVTLGSYIKTGIDVQLTQLFGDTRIRRIKTSEEQTELLLSQKTQAFKDFGLIQRFNLYVQFYNLYKGISFKVGYQFLKQGDDELGLSLQTFSNKIANEAEYLKERTAHQIILNASYEPDNEWRVNPYVSIFARLPFNGKRTALLSTIGAVFSLSF